MHLYMIRHGESGGNAGSDHSDDPGLTERGWAQAHLVAQALVGEGITALYASPLTRSLETASEIKAALGLKVNVWPDIAEKWGTGRNVMTRGEVARRWPDVALPQDMPDEWWPQNLPEDEAEAYSRAARVEQVIRTHYEETEARVVVVGHGTFGAILMSQFLGAPPCGYTRFSQANCCISMIEVLPGRAKMVFHNRTCHLPADMIT
jgi:probable phosphoglycerate mutase